MTQSLVNADRIQAIIDMDAIPAPANQPEANSQSQLVATLCGGEPNEILSAQCFPNRFAPGIVDEYIAYDLEARDQHWLGGLGKSWKLRSALGRSPIQTALVTHEDVDVVADEVEAWAVPASDLYDAPEAFVAPDHIVVDNAQFSQMALESAANDAALNAHFDQAYFDNAYFDNLVQRAQQSALDLIHSANQVSANLLPQADLPTELLPDLGKSMAATSDWIEEQQCWLSSELCGFESAYQVGSWLGEQSLAVTNLVAENTLVLGHYLELAGSDLESSEPSAGEAGMEVYVIYVDSEGNSLAVPSSLARAWNRPEAESADQAEEALAESTSQEADWVVLDQIGTQVISVIAKQLDAIGMRLMQASDTLSSWADTQIASREESSVR